MHSYKKKKRRLSSVSVTLKILGAILRIAFAVLIFLLQLAWVYFLVVYPNNLPWLITFGEALAIVATFYICYTDQNTSYKILWIIVIFILPIAGTVWYLLYGYGKSAPKKLQKKADNLYLTQVPVNNVIETLNNPIDKQVARVINAKSGFPCVKGSALKYYTDGEPYFNDMLEDMKKATDYIMLETFIIAEGKMWDKTQEILLERANAGVRVYILFDSFGSISRLKPQTVKRLHSYPNISMVGFNPVGLKITPSLNHRDHRKLIIVDGKIAYIGGVNFADEYVHYIKRFGHWRDGGMRIQGEGLKCYMLLFCQNWFIATKKLLNPFDFATENYPNGSDTCILPFGDSPADDRDPAYNGCMSIIEKAEKTLYISTPYLIIDNEMISALCRAALSGVDVRILVPGVPDKKLVYLVTRSHYARLLKNGVKIYEYTPGFNHTKMVLADGKRAIVGSINLDYRSFLLHYELGTLVLNDSCTLEMQKDFLESVKVSKEVSAEEYEKRPFYVRFCQFILNIIAPLL